LICDDGDAFCNYRKQQQSQKNRQKTTVKKKISKQKNATTANQDQHSALRRRTKKTQVDNIAGYEDINISLRISSNCYFTQRNFCDSGLLQFFLLYSSFSQKKNF